MALKLNAGPKLILVLLVIAGLYVGWRKLENQLVYQPGKDVDLTPAKLSIPYETVMVRTPDGLDLQGWFVPGDGSAAVTNQPTVLFFHDAGCTISGVLDQLRVFHDLRLNVLVFDYRGFGNSPGWPGEKGVGLDALAAYFYLIETRHVHPKQLLLYGEGLGAAVAIELATKVQAAGLITQAAPTTLVDRIGHVHPRIPWILVFGNQFDALTLIKKVNMPVLLIHSVDDQEVPFRHSERLIAAASDPKSLLRIHGAHPNALWQSADACREAIGKFVLQHTAGAGSGASAKSAEPARSSR